MLLRDNSNSGHIIIGRIPAAFLIKGIISRYGQDRAGIGVMFNIIGNIGICLAISDQPVDFINAVVHRLRQQAQAGLGGLDQGVLQIVLEYVITEQADQQAHSQNGAQRENQYTISYAFRVINSLFHAFSIT